MISGVKMRKIINKEKDVLNNVVYLPERGENLSDLPLLIYLHGAGERGENIEHISRHAIPKLIDNGAEYNAVVLCPQCPADVVWDNIVDKIKNTIDKTVAEYNIKPDRIVLTGSSMGGFGSVMMGMTYRNFFAAIAPVAAAGMFWRTPNLSGTPLLFYHGDKDEAVPIEYTLMIFERLKNAGYDVELKVFEGLNHNDSIDAAYDDSYLLDWLLSKRRTDFSYIPEFLEEMF